MSCVRVVPACVRKCSRVSVSVRMCVRVYSHVSVSVRICSHVSVNVRKQVDRHRKFTVTVCLPNKTNENKTNKT